VTLEHASVALNGVIIAATSPAALGRPPIGGAEDMSPTLTRRRLIRSGADIALFAPLAGVAAGCGTDAGDQTNSVPVASPSKPRSGSEALDRLVAGNERFVAGTTANAGQDSVRRVEIAQGQEPFAIVLGCSDSRVPPTVIFDQGLGDLFVIRVAGNTATSPIVVGSVEYAAEHLHSVLVMVLGHSSCGAVKAAVAEVTTGSTEEGSIRKAVAPIVPVVEQAHHDDPGLSEDELVEQSISANIERALEDLQAQPILSHLVEAGDLKIVGAEYDLHSGKVRLL
jgi:carbonic anhydrase